MRIKRTNKPVTELSRFEQESIRQLPDILLRDKQARITACMFGNQLSVQLDSRVLQNVLKFKLSKKHLPLLIDTFKQYNVLLTVLFPVRGYVSKKHIPLLPNHYSRY